MRIGKRSNWVGSCSQGRSLGRGELLLGRDLARGGGSSIKFQLGHCLLGQPRGEENKLEKKKGKVFQNNASVQMGSI